MAKGSSKKRTFGTRWIKYTLIPLESYWAYCVGIVEDIGTGERYVRIARGKIKGRVETIAKGKTKYTLVDKSDPITQVNRLNIKRKWEWKEINPIVNKFFKKLEEQKKSMRVVM